MKQLDSLQLDSWQLAISQQSAVSGRRSEFGFWNFEFVWNLEFGIWNSAHASMPPCLHASGYSRTLL